MKLGTMRATLWGVRQTAALTVLILAVRYRFLDCAQRAVDMMNGSRLDNRIIDVSLYY